MAAAVLAAVGLSAAWLFASTTWSILRPDQRTYPPGPAHPWLNRVSQAAAAVVTLGVPALALIGWGGLALARELAFALGIVPFGLGAWLSLSGVFTLGLERSTRTVAALELEGPYRFSRNPQYVGSILVFLGLSLLCGSALGLAGTALTAPWFLAMPFAEEPWLRETFGRPYEAYAARVPRFLGRTRPPAAG